MKTGPFLIVVCIRRQVYCLSLLILTTDDFERVSENALGLCIIIANGLEESQRWTLPLISLISPP